MGSPPSPILANIFVEDFEENFVQLSIQTKIIETCVNDVDSAINRVVFFNGCKNA